MSHGSISRRSFLKDTAALAAAGAVAAGAAGESPSAAAGAPNIVFMLIDDLRFDALGVLGHPFVETPHLDAIARGGVICENAFVTSSLCSPSRASILTGQYAHTHGVLDNVTPMPENTPLFPVVLQQAGYDTCFTGKWHMGGESDGPQPGFNHWVSFKGQGVYVDPVFNINGKQEKQSGYVTDLITDRAVEFIGRERTSPFFLYVSHKAVHAEFHPADRHRDCYRDKAWPRPESMADTEENYRGKPEWVRRQRKSWHGVDGMYNDTVDYDTFTRRYTETLRAVDDSAGRIMDALREKGVLENTLFVFTSDNGFQFGEHGLIDKRTMYEASIRVPLLAHCPALIPAGSRCSGMVLNIDFAPTFIEAAGLPVPENIQGASFLKLLKGENTPWRGAFLYEYFWERSFPQTPTVLGVRTDTHKLMQYHGVWDCYEMYDLENDPDEMNNLLAGLIQKHESGTLDGFISAKAPEPVRKTFKQLHKTLMDLLKETGARPEPVWSGGSKG